MKFKIFAMISFGKIFMSSSAFFDISSSLFEILAVMISKAKFNVVGSFGSSSHLIIALWLPLIRLKSEAYKFTGFRLLSFSKFSPISSISFGFKFLFISMQIAPKMPERWLFTS